MNPAFRSFAVTCSFRPVALLSRKAPSTAVLGAILLTGYLGGAIATQVRHEDGWVPIVLCVVFGALLGSGLLLRDARLRAVLPGNR
jgi:hypothetical protein